MIGQLQSGDTSQRPSHDPQIFSKIFYGELLSYLFKNNVGILSEIGESGNPAAYSVAPVISNHQVQPLLMIEEGDLIIVAHHLAIPMEE